MTRNPGSDPRPAGAKTSGTTTSGARSREDRLKAALKANMGRRKAQARAQAEGEGETGTRTPTPMADDDDKPGDATAAGNDKE